MPPAAATAAGRATSKLSDNAEAFAYHDLTGQGGAYALLDRPAAPVAAPARAPRPERVAPAPPARRPPRPEALVAPLRIERPAPRRVQRETVAPAPRRVQRAPAPSPAPRRVERSAPAPAAPRRRPTREPRPLVVTGPERVFRDRAPQPAKAAARRRRSRLGALRLDRIVRGRAWIPVLGVLLVGVVGMRVEVLKLGTRVGASVQMANQLQGENQALESKVAQLAGAGRIERLAGLYGMVVPGPEDDKFVSVRSGHDLRAAIAGIHAPAPTSFEQRLAAQDLANYESAHTVIPASQLTASLSG